MARREKKSENVSAKPEDDRFEWSFVEQTLSLIEIRTLFLFGPPGVGKTYAAYRYRRPEQATYAITLTQDTPAAELRGSWIPQGDAFVWNDGNFVKAMREGARLVINELSHASEDVLALLHPVLESAETARLTLPNGETVVPAPGFQVVCTDNESPASLPAALRDRFEVAIEIEEPHPDALERLGEDLRHAALQSLRLEPERAVGLRAWLTIQKLRERLGLRQACRLVLGRQRGALIYDALALGQEALPF